MFPDSPEIRSRVIAEAENWKGTPFRHNALVQGCGVGCGTLLVGVYGALGIPVPTLEEIGHFSRDWHQHTDQERYLNILLKYSKIVPEPKPGDMVIFKMKRVFGHSGIVTAWPSLIHVLWGSTVQGTNAEQMPLQRYPRLFLSPFA